MGVAVDIMIGGIIMGILGVLLATKTNRRVEVAVGVRVENFVRVRVGRDDRRSVSVGEGSSVSVNVGTGVEVREINWVGVTV